MYTRATNTAGFAINASKCLIITVSGSTHALVRKITSIFWAWSPLLTGESLALSVAFLVEAFAYPHSFHHRVIYANDFQHVLGNGVSVAALQGLLVVSVAVLTAVVALVLQLCGFHAMLIWKNMTTYNFIVNEQKRQREKEAARTLKKLEMQNRASSPQRDDRNHSEEEADEAEGAGAVVNREGEEEIV